MITSSFKALNETKAKVAHLEQALAKELASLPSAYGFDSLKAFVAAIKAAGGKGRVGRPKKSTVSKTRKRAKITDAIRAKVGKFVKSGKTGSQIAKALKLSGGRIGMSRAGILETRVRLEPGRSVGCFRRGTKR